MLVFFLRGGQASRSTELFSLEHRNGASTLRGLCIHNGSVVSITRHAKARHATNREFQVARYLPREESVLLATYLAYVRPFTDMLCRVCLGHERERNFFFSLPDGQGRPWKSLRLTKALKELSNETCGVSFGLQVYRQLSIAVAEKHARHVAKPFNRYDDKGPDAVADVAFVWQSGDRPLQQSATYGIDAAYPDSLQPGLLHLYQWASAEWHRFLNADEISILKDVELTHDKERRNHLSTTARKRPAPSPPPGGGHTGKRRHLVDTQARVRFPSPAAQSEGCSITLANLNRTVHSDSQVLRGHAPGLIYDGNSPTAATRASAKTIFAIIPQFGLIVCRVCRHAVWPTEVCTHLAGSSHKMDKRKRVLIAQELTTWRGLVHSVRELELPSQLPEPIPELILRDGLMCKLNPGQYHAIRGSLENMRRYWRVTHDGWTVSGGSRRGGLSKSDRSLTAQRIQEGCEKVKYQQFFVTRTGSQYIRVVDSEFPALETGLVEI